MSEFVQPMNQSVQPAEEGRSSGMEGGGCHASVPATASACRRTCWVVGWLALVLIGINVVHDASMHDKTLVPRLHALLIVLGASGLALGLPRVLRRCDPSIVREPVVLSALALVACTALSLLAAVNVSAGWLDLVRTSAFAGVLVVSCLLLPLVPRWPDHLLRLLVVSAAVTAGLGWAEFIMRYGINVPGRRWIEDVSGRMGNINLLSSYLVLVLPGCLGAACLLRGVWRGAGTLAGVASLALVIVLQSRSAWVALAASALVALAVAWRLRERLGIGRVVRNVMVTGAVGITCGIAACGSLASPDHPIMARLRSIGVANPDGRPSDGGRTVIWWLTTHLIADHPLVGVGAGNFPIRIQEYYATPGADLARLHTDDWSRPHNDFLQVWAEKGVLGLAAFIGIFVAALASIVAVLRVAVSPRDAGLALLLLMSIVTYLVASCFDFPLERISHQATLAVLLAAATVLRRGVAVRAAGDPLHAARREPTWGDGPEPTAVGLDGCSDVPAAGASGLPSGLVWGVVSAGLVATACGLAWTTVAISQERSAVGARAALEAGRWDDAVRLARGATTPWRTLDPFGTPVAFLEGAAHMRSGAVDEAIACLERARRHHPNRLVVLNNLGILYATTGRTDDAIECLSVAASRYPHRLESVTNLAACYLDAGRPTEAVELLERVPEASRSPVMREHLARGRELLGSPADASPPQAER